MVKAEDRPLQERLRSMENKEIALLLKGRRPFLRRKIKLSNLSATRRLLVEEERAILGPVPR
ncbi:hypothetical protein MASR2M78_05650 [Treponema sp.]